MTATTTTSLNSLRHPPCQNNKHNEQQQMTKTRDDGHIPIGRTQYARFLLPLSTRLFPPGALTPIEAGFTLTSTVTFPIDLSIFYPTKDGTNTMNYLPALGI
jgi:hypothetical protein